MNTLKRDLWKCLPSNEFFLVHGIESKCPKNIEKEKIEYEVVEFDHETNVSGTNDDKDFKVETAANFPLSFN